MKAQWIGLVGVACLSMPWMMGCRGQTSHDTPMVFIRNMYDQPKYEIQSESAFFPDHRTMRLPVEGVVAREAAIDSRIGQGVDETGAYVLTLPAEVAQRAGGIEKLLLRGQDRYRIYCSPCHDMTGRGHGMIARRAAVIPGAAALNPTNLHKDSVRHMPDGQLFATITHGVRNMPPYGPQVPVEDRWAIVSYVRALELSQASQNPEANP